MIVYALIDPRCGAIRYVGKTVRTPHRRLRRHLSPCYLNGNTHKERWIKILLSLGLEPTIIVLQSCGNVADLGEAERFHIARLLRKGAKLTNLTPGGDGGGGKHSAESKKKISNALRGKVRSEIHCRRIGLANRGRRISDVTRTKLRLFQRTRQRKPLTDMCRINISRAKGGRPFVDQKGNRYETIKGAARTLGLNVGHLWEVLHGTRKRVKGYMFRFVSKEELRVQEYPKRKDGE